MLLLGFIIDEFIIVLMCAPIFTPIAVSLGYDPVWFGILMILNIEIAIQTPPMASPCSISRASRHRASRCWTSTARSHPSY